MWIVGYALSDDVKCIVIEPESSAVTMTCHTTTSSLVLFSLNAVPTVTAP